MAARRDNVKDLFSGAGGPDPAVTHKVGHRPARVCSRSTVWWAEARLCLPCLLCVCRVARPGRPCCNPCLTLAPPRLVPLKTTNALQPPMLGPLLHALELHNQTHNFASIAPPFSWQSGSSGSSMRRSCRRKSGRGRSGGDGSERPRCGSPCSCCSWDRGQAQQAQ